MVAHKWLVYLTLLWSIASLIDAGCVCSEKGTDYCAACSGRRVVRPKQRHSEGRPDIDIAPIGDKCWCTKKMIEPAVVPKVVKTEKKKPCGCRQSSSCGCGQSSSSSLPSIFTSSSSGSYAVPQATYFSSTSQDDSLPADPISVSLAIQAGKAIEVPEAKLAYGFMQKPIDGLPKVYMSSVNEENLYALNSDVITLKKKTQGSNAKPAEDEYPDADDEEANANDGGADDDDDQPRLTYKQLGYVAEEYKNPTFQEVSSSYVASNKEESERYVVRGKVSVDCGYKPGRIAPYRKSKHGGLGKC